MRFHVSPWHHRHYKRFLVLIWSTFLAVFLTWSSFSNDGSYLTAWLTPASAAVNAPHSPPRTSRPGNPTTSKRSTGAANAGPVYTALVLDDARHQLYGSNLTTGNLDVISTSNLQTITSISFGGSASGLDLSPDGSELAVAVEGGNQIAFVDPSTFAITDRINTPVPIGAVRYGRPGRLYGRPGVRLGGSLDYIRVYDTTTKTQVGQSTASVWSGEQILISSDYNFLIVPETYGSPTDIERFDVTTDTPLYESWFAFESGTAFGLSALPDLTRIFSATGQIITGDLFSQLTTLPVDGSWTSYSPVRGQLYLSGATEVYEVDASNYSIRRSFFVGTNTGPMCVSADGSILYVNVGTGIETFSLGPSLGLKAQSGMQYADLVVDAPRQRVYGSNTLGNSIDVIPWGTSQPIQSILLGSEPASLDLSPDGSSLAVALPLAGQIDIIGLNALAITNTLGSPTDSDPISPWLVRFGRPGRLYVYGTPYNQGPWGYLHVFDTSSGLEISHSAELLDVGSLLVTSDHNTVYLANTVVSPGDPSFFKYDVSTDTPKLLSSGGPPGGANTEFLWGATIAPDGSRLFTANGQIWSGDLSAQIGSLSATGQSITFNATRNRLYLTGAWESNQPLKQVYELDPTSGVVTHVYQTSTAASVAQASVDGTGLFASTYDGIVPWSLDAVPRAMLPISFQTFQAPYSDDFSDPASGWPTQSDDVATQGYVAGQYQIDINEAGWVTYAGNNLNASDFDASVTAQTSTPSAGSYGLYFGHSGSGLYLFDVTPGGLYQLLRLDYTTNTWYTVYDLHSSSAILPGDQPNQLEVRRNGAVITMLINGQIVGQVVDGVLGTGDVGLEATSTEANHIVNFDNFSLAYGAPAQSQTVSSLSQRRAPSPVYRRSTPTRIRSR